MKVREMTKTEKNCVIGFAEACLRADELSRENSCKYAITLTSRDPYAVGAPMYPIVSRSETLSSSAEAVYVSILESQKS